MACANKGEHSPPLREPCSALFSIKGQTISLPWIVMIMNVRMSLFLSSPRTKSFTAENLLLNKAPQTIRVTRDRRDRKFRDDTDIDTFCGPESRPILIPILFVALNRDRYWYWYHKNVPGLILIPILYLIRILPGPCKKCSGLWIDTGTDTETQKKPRSRPILIPKGLVSAFSIRYWYSRLSLEHMI